MIVSHIQNMFAIFKTNVWEIKKYSLFLNFCLLRIINEIEQNGRQNVIGDAAKCCHGH